MRNDRYRATVLRLQGRSYNEIAQLTGAPKSTLSGWLKDLELPEKARERIRKRVREKSVLSLIARNKKQSHLAEQRSREIRANAQKEVGILSPRELFIAGASLYWAEGYKRPVVRNGRVRTSHSVRLTNSDPQLVRMFLRFLREICNVPEEKISANVRVYEHQNEGYLLQFWSQKTGIPLSQFKKSYYGVSKSSQGKRPFNILPYGTIQIVVGDTALYHRIMGWIDGLV